ncbi:hypothetical protein CRG98_050312 [Punica granatum]|uniref:F-box associated domain-containing protein n=1 Tax=Punica granatum TaxID=22663 RepID=A0A2I0GJH5_PUNGR|nr:hypothetical protein CRG98_050312 [Punica granatum]
MGPNLKGPRLKPLRVPYDDGRLYIFGGAGKHRACIEIHDTKSSQFKQSKDAPLDVNFRSLVAYFLWDSITTIEAPTAGGKKLIMLYSPLPESRLLSYDMEENHWDMFDCQFPICPCPTYRRNLNPLGGNTLLIIDVAAYWLIYDLSLRRVTANLEGHGLKRDGAVTHAFCRPSSKGGGMTVSIFMRANRSYDDIPYAKTCSQRQTIMLYGFYVLSEWTVLRSPSFYLRGSFVEQTNKRAAEETHLGPGESCW